MIVSFSALPPPLQKLNGGQGKPRARFVCMGTHATVNGVQPPYRLVSWPTRFDCWVDSQSRTEHTTSELTNHVSLVSNS